jgi:hypothetical protein
MPQITTPLLPTTSLFDLTSLRDIDVKSEEFKEFIVRLYQEVNKHAIFINQKDHGIYSIEQYGSCKQYFPAVSPGNFRGIARTALPFTFVGFSPGTVTVPHNIVFNADTRVTLLQSEANNPAGQLSLPIPYVDVTGAGAGNIQISMDNTNVYIVTAIDYTAYTDNFIVIEYTT